MNSKDVLFIGLILSLSLISFGQEHESEDISEEFKRHRVSIIIGHGHVFGAEIIESGANVLTIPTWGIDYSFWFTERFGASIMGDLEIMEYVIPGHEENSKIIRENPFIISTVFLFKAYKGLILFTGPGIEFEKHENLFIVRIGASYEIEITKHWDLTPELVFDIKGARTSAFSLGIGIGKKF
jgi:hypothetical protein